MPSSVILHNSSFAASWLHEAPGLAPAFTHLFLLNVFPYGDVFTSPAAELNGPSADLAAQAYRAHAFAPPELNDVAAPDHLGLQLAFLDHLAARDDPPALASALAALLAWAPAACLAVQREPEVHPFYAELAQATQRALFAQAAGRDLPPLGLAPPAPGPLPDPEGEVRLRDLAAFFLAPARCGLWLSRGRLGRIASGLGLALPFGPRAEVAAALFAAAGSAGQFDALLDALSAELSHWNRECAAWPPALAAPWLSRYEEAAHQLGLIRAAITSADADH
jgi:TorA maturation chaperone TorD